MIDNEFKALLMHKIFFLFLCGQLWPEEDDFCADEEGENNATDRRRCTRCEDCVLKKNAEKLLSQ